MRVSTLALLAALPVLAACGQTDSGAAPAPEEPAARMAEDNMGSDAAMMDDSGDDAVAMALADPRRGEGAARDEFRNPAATLDFFGFEPDMTVVEIWPGGGWYADVLAPALAAGGGTYYAAGFDPARSEGTAARVAAFKEKYEASGEYGDVVVTVFGADSGEIAPAGSADMVLTFRNVHNWTGAGFAEKAFGDFYAALKPGGVLGVVEHRMPEAYDEEEMASSGYVKESTVIALAEAAGFELAGRSDVNANADDDADHPFGVWTLPPVSRTTDREGNTPEGFDAASFKAIGESDRMTLRFVKPLAADGPLTE